MKKINRSKKGFFIFGLILFLGISAPIPQTTIMEVRAEETQDIKLNVNSQTIVKGKSFSLYVYNLSKDQTVTFASSSPEIASVNASGTVTGNLVGTATIFATISEGGQTVTILPCEIKVGPPAISIQFSRIEISMIVGQKLTLERIVQPLNTVETAKFSSNNRAIATVSAGGRVTAKAEGTTYIFAQIDNGDFAVCKISVLPKETATHTAVSTSETNTTITPSPSKSNTTANITPSATEPGEEPTPTTKKTEKVDFETFIKNLNADDKIAAEENTTSTTDANN